MCFFEKYILFYFNEQQGAVHNYARIKYIYIIIHIKQLEILLRLWYNICHTIKDRFKSFEKQCSIMSGRCRQLLLKQQSASRYTEVRFVLLDNLYYKEGSYRPERLTWTYINRKPEKLPKNGGTYPF